MINTSFLTIQSRQQCFNRIYIFAIIIYYELLNPHLNKALTRLLFDCFQPLMWRLIMFPVPFLCFWSLLLLLLPLLVLSSATIFVMAFLFLSFVCVLLWLLLLLILFTMSSSFLVLLLWIGSIGLVICCGITCPLALLLGWFASAALALVLMFALILGMLVIV